MSNQFSVDFLVLLRLQVCGSEHRRNSPILLHQSGITVSTLFGIEDCNQKNDDFQQVTIW